MSARTLNQSNRRSRTRPPAGWSLLIVASILAPGMFAACDPVESRARDASGAASAAAEADPPPDASGSETFRLEPVADGVYATVVRDGISPSQFAASLIVLRSDHVLVVDSRHDAASADELIATIRGLTDLPVRYLVNTHWHGDHVQGNARFREAYPDIRLVGGATIDADMATSGRERLDGEIEALAARIEAARGWLESGERDGTPLTEEQREALPAQIASAEEALAARRAIELIPPEITVEQELRLDDAEPVVEIVRVGPAHTRGDVIVRVPARGVLAIGDLIEDGFPWFGDGYPHGWAVAMDRIAGMEEPILLGGHTPVLYDRDLFDTQREFVRRIVEGAGTAAATGHRGGTGAEAAMETAIDAAIEAADVAAFRDHFTSRMDGASDEERTERFDAFVADVMERAVAEASGTLAEATATLGEASGEHEEDR